jgi:glucose-1-phosphate thymidylyltransferase
MKAIIPTGGRGTRMQPITFSSNKHFIPVANKPLIFYPIESVVAAGVRDILVTYNPGWLDLVTSYLGTGEKWNAHITYVLQEKPAGLANVVQVCEEALHGESFVYHLGDNIFSDGITKYVEYFMKKKPNGLLLKVHHPENTRMGVPYFTKQGKLIKYVEKPKNPPHDFAVPGLYMADSHAFDAFKGKDRVLSSERGELEIPSVFQWLVDHKYDVDVLEYEGVWLDPGKFGDWIESNQYLLDRFAHSTVSSPVSNSVSLIGRVSIGDDCKIDHSELRGPVSIGNNVIIRNSYIGPYTSISDNCVIDHAHIENSVLMDHVTITNISQAIDRSLIGSATEITDDPVIRKGLELFVGEKSVIKL